MNPIESLKSDHRTVEGLFAELESGGSSGSRQKQALVKKLVEELTLHTQLEEKILYPFIREQVPDMDDEILEAFEEHRVVKNTLAELKRAKSGDERLMAKIKVLKENVKHHVEEEESSILPRLEESCSEDELLELGERLDEARASGMKRSRKTTRTRSSSTRTSSKTRRAA